MEVSSPSFCHSPVAHSVNNQVGPFPYLLQRSREQRHCIDRTLAPELDSSKALRFYLISANYKTKIQKKIWGKGREERDKAHTLFTPQKLEAFKVDSTDTIFLLDLFFHRRSQSNAKTPQISHCVADIGIPRGLYLLTANEIYISHSLLQ